MDAGLWVWAAWESGPLGWRWPVRERMKRQWGHEAVTVNTLSVFFLNEVKQLWRKNTLLCGPYIIMMVRSRTLILRCRGHRYRSRQRSKRSWMKREKAGTARRQEYFWGRKFSLRSSGSCCSHASLWWGLKNIQQHSFYQHTWTNISYSIASIIQFSSKQINEALWYEAGAVETHLY